MCHNIFMAEREEHIKYIELLVTHERELREQGEKKTADALKLQASEYERRLMDLNHAHEQAREVLHTYATRDSVDQRFEAKAKEFQAYKDATDKALTLREGTDTGKALSAKGYITLLGAIATILGIVVVVTTYLH